jgi:predicted GIY-YIG superfamily endonuclease
MSFAECAARSFTAVSIQKNAPESSGVYGLSNGREWIFIGEASNIRARLMEHLEEADTTLKHRKPTGFTFEECSPGDRVSRQDALVRQFEPFCNRRSGYTTGQVHRRVY